MSTSDGSTPSFLRELKRRKVLRTTALYVLLCWGALQVGDIVFPAMGLDPDSASRVFIILALLGLPVTIALAWFFQITSDGIVRTTSFVERRVLNNLSPINNRRRDSVATYFKAGDEAPEYNWIMSGETGPLTGLSFGINKTLILGRALECDIAVVSSHISRQHARFDLDGDKLTIEDLGSANGTLVNGKLIHAKHELRNEDELRFHDIIFRVTVSYSRPRQESESMHQTTMINIANHTKDRT